MNEIWFGMKDRIGGVLTCLNYEHDERRGGGHPAMKRILSKADEHGNRWTRIYM